MSDKELHAKLDAFDFPSHRDFVVWRELFNQLPSFVHDAIYMYAPTMPPDEYGMGAIAWAVIAAHAMLEAQSDSQAG